MLSAFIFVRKRINTYSFVTGMWKHFQLFIALYYFKRVFLLSSKLFKHFFLLLLFRENKTRYFAWFFILIEQKKNGENAFNDLYNLFKRFSRFNTKNVWHLKTVLIFTNTFRSLSSKTPYCRNNHSSLYLFIHFGTWNLIVTAYVQSTCNGFILKRNCDLPLNKKKLYY